jgi:hypothetical protein
MRRVPCWSAVGVCLVALSALSCVRTLTVRPGDDCALSDDQVARVVAVAEGVAANHGLSPSHARKRHAEALGTGSSATRLLVYFEGRHGDGYATLAVRLRSSPRRILLEVRDPSRSGDTDFTREIREALDSDLREALPGCGFSSWPRPGQ